MNRTRGLVARRAFVLLVALAGLLGVAGCNGGNAGTQSPPESVAQTSDTPTPKPTSTAYAAASKDHPARNVPKPVMPEVAKQQTKEGWEAFAKYYIDELNYMVETNDPSRVKQLTTKGCEYCREQLVLAKFFADNKQWLVGGKFSLEYVTTQMAPTETGTIAGLLTMSRADSKPTEARGELPVRPGIQSSNWSMTLYWYQGAWAVDRLEAVR